MTIILGPDGAGEPSDTRQLIERERVTEQTTKVTTKRFAIALFVIAAAILGFALILNYT
ncbi:MAG: hypothetical protein WKG01_13465 [Kofleriaceae bacterium]